MTHTIRRIGRWLLALFFATSAALAQSAPPPAEHFARRPAIDEVALSPSGTRLAMLVYNAAGRRRLGVMDLDPIGPPRAVAEFGDADIERVHWVSDDRLVFEAAQPQYEISLGGAGTFAIDHDGKNQRQLIAWRSSAERPGSATQNKILPYGWFLHSVTDDGSRDVFVVQRVNDSVGDLRHVKLARMSTVTGELTHLSAGMPEGAHDWIVDVKGEPRVLTASRKGREHLYWRAAGSDTWTEIAAFDPLTEGGFTPLHVDADGQILVSARAGGDVSALHRFDPVTRRLDPEPLVKVTGYDLNPQLALDVQTRRLVGLHFRADRPLSHWFDAELQRTQAGIDAALPPGRFNRLYCGRCESSRFIVVRSLSDRQPGEYLLYDRRKRSLETIGAARPWIDESQQGRRTLHRVAARDGLPIPVFVTHPPGMPADRPLPTVLIVHGGPWVRGSDLRWHAEAQFFASRGYRVLQPEFRGSVGFGWRHFHASWKQWGLAMQDDLVDTVQWAARERLTDTSKVCVTGGSYGGYAALMAPIASPGVFRCAASFAGVTDIGLMYSVHWSDIPDYARRYGMPVVIGDPQKDAERLARASPLKRVEEIRVPLLVAYGSLDRRVPVAHAREFLSAARRANVAVEEVPYPAEGHGFRDKANEADYLERLERFFGRSLAADK